MPLVIATILRQVIMAAVTIGVLSLAESVILPLINGAISKVMQLFGVSEEDATTFVANGVIQAAEEIGILALTLSTKLPVKVAERLGFTSKGFKKRALSPAGKSKLPNIAGTPEQGAQDIAIGGLAKKAVEVEKALIKPGISLSLGKGILTVTGVMVGWNLLTDWVWIGSSLSFLPAGDASDIQKRALTILKLMDSPRSLIYSAEKSRRQLSQQERTLIKDIADEAEKQIKELTQTYNAKYVLYGKQDVLRELTISTTTLLLELQTLRQMAGLIPRQPVEKVKIEAIVATVFDGDTIKLDTGETVRLVGIDAPESTTPAGEESKRYLKARITGKKVRVESDPNALIDIYGRRLGVIYLIE